MTDKELQAAIDKAVEAVKETAFFGTPSVIADHLAKLYAIQQERARNTDKASQ